MHIKDHNDAMTFFRNSKQLESNGKWKEFVEESKFDDMLQESRPMAQGGRIGYDDGQLVRPTVDGSRPGYAESKHSRFTPSVYDDLTADMKKYYEDITGKKWNKKDWDEGNYRKINKSRKAKDVVKKTQKLSPYYKKVGFFDQYKINQRMLVDEAKLEKRGYISARKLNETLGRDATESSIDDLKRVIDGDRESAWLDEIEGVKKWKNKKNFSFIDTSIGGQKFYKMPDKTTIKGLKKYYKNQEYLSKFKEGKIKGPTVDAAKVFYDDKVLMNNLRKWSGNTKEIDKHALKVLNSVFGSDSWQGPNAIKNLGRALSGEIKIEGIKVDKALGKKILDGMSRTANSKYGGSIWDQAAYQYAKDRTDMLFNNKGSRNYRQLYNDTSKILEDVLGKKRSKVAIDEVLSLRTGFTNDQQVYSIFSQVIDEKINKNFKKSYDANLSKNLIKVRKELALGPEADLDKIKGWTDQQNKLLAKAQKDYPGIKFANMGEFNYETGKFAKPAEVFGEKRFADLPSDIQKRIRKSYRDTKVSVDVAGAGTQKEVISDLKKASNELSNLKPRQQMELLKKMGYRCRRGVGGKETVSCYMSDVEKTRADMKSPNVEVRAKALTKQRKVLQLAQKIPAIGKMLRRGIQGTLGTLGLAGPIGWAVEGLIEGGIYDYYRRKGYDHNQAFAETFTPRLAYEGFQGKSTEDVPWYGGAEALREQDRIYEAIGAKEQAKEELELAETGFDATLLPGDLDAASADVQDLARSGAYGRVDRTLDPESMASQAYNTAVENRDALDQRRRTEYLEKYDPQALEHEQKSFDIYARDKEGEILYEKPQSMYKKRYKEMDEMYPDYSKEDIDYILKNMYGTSMKELGEGYTYENIGKWFKDKDKSSYFADNFRMEKAEGGIASLKK
jgi:hypothetical protein